jgi:hypothetical protein
LIEVSSLRWSHLCLVGPGAIYSKQESLLPWRCSREAPGAAQSAATPAPELPRERLLLDFGWRFHLGNAQDTSQIYASYCTSYLTLFLAACWGAFSEELAGAW